jgi:hypothetical protein
MPATKDAKTGAPVNGRTNRLVLTLIDTPPENVSVKNSTIYINGGDTVPLRPAMNAPSTEVQKFQNGDYTAATTDAGYASDTIVGEYNADDYESLDVARTCGLRWKVQRLLDGESEPSDTGIAALVTVNEAPAVAVGELRVPTMSHQIDYVGTQNNKLGGGAK